MGELLNELMEGPVYWAPSAFELGTRVSAANKHHPIARVGVVVRQHRPACTVLFDDGSSGSFEDPDLTLVAVADPGWTVPPSFAVFEGSTGDLMVAGPFWSHDAATACAARYVAQFGYNAQRTAVRAL